MRRSVIPLLLVDGLEILVQSVHLLFLQLIKIYGSPVLLGRRPVITTVLEFTSLDS